MIPDVKPARVMPLKMDESVNSSSTGLNFVPISTCRPGTYNYISRVSYKNKGPPSIGTPDLGSLNWLQRDNLLKIRPIDDEDGSPRPFLDDDEHPTSKPITNAVQQRTESPAFAENEKVNSLITTSNAAQLTISQFLRGGESKSSLLSSPKLNHQAHAPPTTINQSQNCNNLINPSIISTSPAPILPPATPASQQNSENMSKPSYSYTHLIFMAIESSPTKCMTVNQIYNWCESNFPFYKHAGAGWKNSLRHNLSINKSFKRLPRDGRGPGRGAFWTVEPRERQNLLDALRRNPINLSTLSALAANASNQYSAASTLNMINSLGNGNGQAGNLNSIVLPSSLNPAQILNGIMNQQSDIPLDAETSSVACILRRLLLDNLLGKSANSTTSSTDSGFDSSAGTGDIQSLTTAMLLSAASNNGGKNSLLGGVFPQTDEATTAAVVMAASNAAKTLLRTSSPPPEYESKIFGATRKKWGNWQQFDDAREEENFEEAMKLLNESVAMNQAHMLGTSLPSSFISNVSTLPMTESIDVAEQVETTTFEPEQQTGPANTNTAVSTGTEMTNSEAGTTKRTVTKQRRKTRLLPTTESSNKCAECKENENSTGCEACQTRRIHYFSEQTLQAPSIVEQERSPQSILDQLDADQEIGPAGFPAFNMRSRDVRMLEIVYPPKGDRDQKDDPESASSNNNDMHSSTVALPVRDDEDEEAVLITPAPFLDHEYAHCQAQLRKMPENMLVSRYNARLRWLLENRGIGDFNASLGSSCSSTSISSQLSLAAAAACAALALSNSDSKSSGNESSNMTSRTASILAALSALSSQQPVQRLASNNNRANRPAGTGSGDTNENYKKSHSFSRVSRRRKFDANSGGAKTGLANSKKRDSGQGGPDQESRRRSNRVIKAPRRPYEDDFADSLSENDYEDDYVDYDEYASAASRGHHASSTRAVLLKAIRNAVRAHEMDLMDSADEQDMSGREDEDTNEDFIHEISNNLNENELRLVLKELQMAHRNRKRAWRQSPTMSSDEEPGEEMEDFGDYDDEDGDADSCSGELPANASPDVLEQKYLRYAAAKQRGGSSTLSTGGPFKRPRAGGKASGKKQSGSSKRSATIRQPKWMTQTDSSDMVKPLAFQQQPRPPLQKSGRMSGLQSRIMRNFDYEDMDYEDCDMLNSSCDTVQMSECAGPTCPQNKIELNSPERQAVANLRRQCGYFSSGGDESSPEKPSSFASSPLKKRPVPQALLEGGEANAD